MAPKSTTLLNSNPASVAFHSATLTTKNIQQQQPTAKDEKLTAYYRDSSGRACVQIRAQLDFSNGSSQADALLECGCIEPAPVESEAVKKALAAVSDKGEEPAQSGKDEEREDGAAWRDELSTIGKEEGGDNVKHFSSVVDTVFTFECTATSSAGNRISNCDWAVERVTIINCTIQRASEGDPKSSVTALLFDIEVAVRGNGMTKIDRLTEILEQGELELCAVLRQKSKVHDNIEGGSESNSNNSLLGGQEGAKVAAGLLGLDLGVSVSSSAAATARKKNKPAMHYGTKIMRTNPVQINVELLPPLQLSVREVSGARAASGSTLVEITVAHCTRWHKEKVAVTGIAFHPGQSRLWEPVHDQNDENNNTNDDLDGTTSPTVRKSDGKSMQGGELSVVDMSRRVRWGFLPGSAPELPLVLGPHEAYSTVIQIDAGEDVRSRIFDSPITVNAMICSCNSPLSATINDDAERVMVTADARWTSSRVGVENSDAFRLDMYLRGGLETVCVGAPIVVSLRVLNLSMEPRDLMLLMAKDGEGRNSGLQWERPTEESRSGRGSQILRTKPMLHNRDHPSMSTTPSNNNRGGFNTAVVSEVNGYTFGVWGLAGDDDGTTRHHRDHELLAVDAALLLGEVKGQHSIEAELRFVPLREGTLDVPNLKLYDKRGGRWYNCVHTLKIVAAAKE
eukprot:CAMPEP_0201687786 /NCGR_PEP_ID=MMETSP0578-20130828/1689_1 /ASSEMBLY_ACC=CAM_ASM_000663 /TAXON_ID=267565 /ORGANISM="Skeletonema grethea, Strain CCMP 1804" /LENGTH=679 /DNA_ID=CAMNT_0048171961 /DNA_START=83 /DNA_END=2122 /DNA_ORIENTATION=-